MAISPQYFENNLEDRLDRAESEIDESLKRASKNTFQNRQITTMVPLGLTKELFDEHLKPRYMYVGWKSVDYVGDERDGNYLRFIY